ncbi:MAG: hypothetical protein M1497_06260 [Nitrospirae bacterium]|nr:hypothetical protein [Nitrospirota bacterium]
MKQAESTQEAKAPAPTKKLERAPAAEAIAKDEARQGSGATAPGAKLSHMEKKKKERWILTVFVKDPEAAGKEIKKTLKELEGKEARAESAEGKKIITAILNSGKVHLLFEKLKLLGDVKEKEMELRASGKDVSVRIEVTRNSRRP